MIEPPVVAIIQARMGSTRFPGKVLAPLAGSRLLEVLVRRLMTANCIDLYLVATTTRKRDDVVASTAKALGAYVFRGSESDVLDRYYRAARSVGAKTIIRITADNPLVDGQFVKWCFGELTASQTEWHYAQAAPSGGFPHGLSLEVMSMAALTWAWRSARGRSEREHVTMCIRYSQVYAGFQLESKWDFSNLRWTVDFPGDLRVVDHLLRSSVASHGWVPLARYHTANLSVLERLRSD